MKCPVCAGTGGIPTCPTCRKSYIEMTPTPRTDAHQSACLRSGGRSCMGGERNAYWLARQLERENVQMLAVMEDLARYPVAGGYYDGPCIERTDMDDIKAAIAAASESQREAAEAADED